MTIHFSDEERGLLLEILHDRLGTLREQVHHVTISTFHEQLKQTQRVVQAMIDKLQAEDVPAEQDVGAGV